MFEWFDLEFWLQNGYVIIMRVPIGDKTYIPYAV